MSKPPATSYNLLSASEAETLLGPQDVRMPVYVMFDCMRGYTTTHKFVIILARELTSDYHTCIEYLTHKRMFGASRRCGCYDLCHHCLLSSSRT